ncbi:hypothetical protein [Halobacillus naozhouensis]|uniref:Uncharacterized protein n=1 Tax=Halobacillus naozhouensis TaxID=554880 RepID=A0ABY8IYL9_9BACI|nr:hypothetical protein [Halobacillus naozhouensis]WFT73826.1 hypothetical protein P9989_15825 [Halobacillus naozhouensis]
MKGKIRFTRLAAQPNRSGMAVPQHLEAKNIICDLTPVVQQFSQLMVSSGNHIWSRAGHLHSFSQKDKAQQNPMAAIRGDESPLSYLQAAVCYHELQQYSYYKDMQWDSQRILDDPYIDRVTRLGLWPFRKMARSLDPIFFYDSLHHPVVIFYTYQNTDGESILKHLHRFNFEGYLLKMHTKIVALNTESSFIWNRIGFN